MEYIVEKIGMSRTIGVPAVAITLLKVIDTKVCELDESKRAIVAYARGKKMNKAIAGQQKKYDLSAEFNRFVTINVSNSETGDLDTAPLSSAKNLKVSFRSKGRGFAGVIKRHGFAGGPASHGSRFHRTGGSIGNAEWPGRVQKGRKMPGHMGDVVVTVKNDVISYDTENGILAVKGAVPGANGALGRVRIAK